MGDEKTASQAEMLGNRLKKRRRHLGKWARRTGTDVYRLYDRDIPEIPLVLDLYGDAVSGALYQRPYEKDEAEEDRWLEAMGTAAAAALDIPRDRIFLKQRRILRGRQQGKVQYGKMAETGFTREVREGGLRFRVNLSDYMDTGLFPDRRRMRALTASEAAGKRVLNLFCYTAAFSVYAAAAGAAGVDSVDISNTYLDWGALNFELNGLRAERVDLPRFLSRETGRGSAGNPRRGSPGEKGPLPHALIHGDVLPFLDGAAAAGLSWDMIILDPPAFSNSKRMRDDLDLRRDHRELILGCLTLLSPGGKLWFSANPRRFTLDPADFPGAAVRDISLLMEDEDFRGKRIPRCFTLQV
jgi:23S rRNA G2069 N7-methylase RlmK/C1962 C5-methylase RlmI